MLNIYFTHPLFIKCTTHENILKHHRIETWQSYQNWDLTITSALRPDNLIRIETWQAPPHVCKNNQTVIGALSYTLFLKSAYLLSELQSLWTPCFCAMSFSISALCIILTVMMTDLWYWNTILCLICYSCKYKDTLHWR